MSGTPRELINSPRRQGTGETRTHSFTVPIGVTPTGAINWTAVKESDGSTHATGTGTFTAASAGAAMSGVITLTGLSGLSATETYKVTVSMVVGAETLTRYFRVEAE